MPSSAAASDAAALRYAVQRLSRRLRRRGDDGLTASQASALATVERHRRLRLGAFARHEQVGKSTLTRVVAKLEAAGYLSRDVDPNDARSFVVELTDLGRKVLQAANERQDAYLEEELTRLDEADRAAVAAAVPALERLLADPR